MSQNSLVAHSSFSRMKGKIKRHIYFTISNHKEIVSLKLSYFVMAKWYTNLYT